MRKRELRSRRPSPALVVATVALIVALGGTAYAGVTVANNSVGSKQLKNNAVTTSKIKNDAVTASKINPSALTAYQGKAEWAQVEGNGAIDAQSGGISVVRNNPGEYFVTFPGDVYGHGVSATLQLRVGLEFSTGNIMVALCGGGNGGITCNTENNVNTIRVQTTDNTNAANTDRAFFIVLLP